MERKEIKTLKKNIRMELNTSQDKEFKALVIRMLTELGKKIEEHSENFNKKLENIKITSQN